jgi:hypothetical protein
MNAPGRSVSKCLPVRASKYPTPSSMVLIRKVVPELVKQDYICEPKSEPLEIVPSHQP